jgi:hypothetical protein
MRIHRRAAADEPVRTVGPRSAIRILRTPEEIDEAVERALDRERIHRTEALNRMGRYLLHRSDLAFPSSRPLPPVQTAPSATIVLFDQDDR